MGGTSFSFKGFFYHYDYYNNKKFIKSKLWAVVSSLSVCSFVCVSFCLSVSVFVSLFVRVWRYVHVCVSINLGIDLGMSVYLSVHLSLCLSSVRCKLSIWWSVFLCICTSQFVSSLPIYRSVSIYNACLPVSLPAQYSVCLSYSVKSSLLLWENVSNIIFTNVKSSFLKP